MKLINKIALFFVVLYSVVIIMNTYLAEYERLQSNVVMFIMNGFAYIISAVEVEKENKLKLELKS